MKVLHVIDSGGLYGAERVLLTLIEALAGANVDCALASIAEPGLAEKPLERAARRRGVDTRRETLAAGPDRRGARALADRAHAEGFDLLHTHGYKANTLIAGQSRAHRKLPVVATLHGWTATRTFSRMGIYQIAERLALRRADRVVAVSDAMVRDWGLRRRYAERLRVIHNGLAVTERRADPAGLPEEIGSFVDGRRSVFAAGRLSREKGFDVLIDALAAVRAGRPDVCLVLAGEGSERASLERRVDELGLGRAVLMPGYLPDAGGLMRHFDVLAIPSRSEGLPVVLLEALLSGVPVAVTAVGEMPAVLSSCDAGGCAVPGDAASLAELIGSLLNQPPDANRRRRIAERAAGRYSAAGMASAHRAVYEELLSPR